MNRKNIPKTDSIQELAHFWDTHDLTDFEDELEEVDEPVFDSLISVQLEPEEFEVIETLAKAHGISPANLIREWVVERIDQTQVRN
ncbi:MAG: CopG family antitoxin [Candidatus Poribacteria bacterium]|nr:CopG family antitoxin [Candidatus Poribacteria bacterium]